MTTQNIHDNPMGLDGFSFIEFASPDPKRLETLFGQFGFMPIARHRTKKATLYRQGQINFVVTAEPNSHAMLFAEQHGPCASAMGFRVQDASKAYARALQLGARPFKPPKGQPEILLPAIYGIGDSLIYFVDQYGADTIYRTNFEPLPVAKSPYRDCGLMRIDHLTHNLQRGHMDHWANEFYGKLFNFHEIRFFDIEGQKTGLISRALASPCGKIKIPLNEAKDDKSQIEEYLHEFKGEGIQHIALSTDDIYTSVETLRQQGLKFLDVPDTYYEAIDARVAGHQEDKARMQRNRILIDGAPQQGQGLLLQIFTENELGPVFFEIIQRKGNDGFGEGNFTALFEAIERDQMRRGVL